MIKGIIFDLDGTTLNTIYDIQDCVNIALKKFGYPEATYDEVRMGLGKGFLELINATAKNCNSEQEKLQICDCYRELYKNNYAIKTKPYDGIIEVLETLQEKGIKLGVNSNKGDELTKNLIKKNFPNIKFVEVIGRRENHPLKPDPEAVYEILEKMDLKKEEVLYIGDSDVDMKTARNADLKSVGCLWGFRDLKTLQDEHADIIISNPKEILDLIWKKYL